MSQLTLDEVYNLAIHRGEICISIFIPTERSGLKTKQNAILFKNKLRDAQQMLKENGISAARVEKIMQPANERLDDTLFWNTQKDGLAVFLSDETFVYFKVPLRLKEYVAVARRFHIKPLLRLFSEDGEYYLLSLNLNDIKLYQCTRDTMEVLDLGDFPTNIKDVYADVEFDKHLSFHTEAPRRPGRRDALFFSRGTTGKEDVKDSISQYLKNLEKQVRSIVQRRDIPLVLAGVDYIVGLYREHNSYPHLLDKWVSGSPGRVSDEELHRQSWEIVSPALHKKINEARDTYIDKKGTRLVSHDIREILPAAATGRIDTFFFDAECTLWGTFDAERQEVRIEEQPTPENEDLVDLIALLTIQNKGTAFSLDKDSMPDDNPIAALFRY